MNNDNLDQRLADALRVEPDAEQLARLASFYASRSRAARRIQLLRLTAVSAAALLVTIAADYWLPGALDLGPTDKLVARSTPSQASPSLPPKPVTPQSSPASSRVVQSELSVRSQGRAPSAHERLAFALQTRRPAPVPLGPHAQAIDAAIDSLASAAAPPAEVDEQLAGIDRGALERLLAARWPLASPPQRKAILRLIGDYGSAQSAPLLLRAARQPALRVESLDAIERLGGTAALAAACAASAEPAVRQAIAGRLIQHGDDGAIDQLFVLAGEPGLLPDLLAAADAVESPQVDCLFDRLGSDDRRNRQIAALLLGQINGPAVTERLIAIVTKNHGAAEAWLALLNCRGESAGQFLASASTNPHFLGHLNHARITRAQMLH